MDRGLLAAEMEKEGIDTNPFGHAQRRACSERGALVEKQPVTVTA